MPAEGEIQNSRAPPSTPLRARFDAPGGGATISVVVKGAQTIKPSLFQVRARGSCWPWPQLRGVLAGGLDRTLAVLARPAARAHRPPRGRRA
jgi:hypothetical protein